MDSVSCVRVSKMCEGTSQVPPPPKEDLKASPEVSKVDSVAALGIAATAATVAPLPLRAADVLEGRFTVWPDSPTALPNPLIGERSGGRPEESSCPVPRCIADSAKRESAVPAEAIEEGTSKQVSGEVQSPVSSVEGWKSGYPGHY